MERIHKFAAGDRFVLLDVMSGAVHLVDEMIYDIMDIFDGANDEAVMDALGEKYSRDELKECLAELHELMESELLFAPDIDVPPTFAEEGTVKSICLMVAHDCNLRCRYCFADTGAFEGERLVMSKETGEKAVDFLIERSKNRKHLEIDFFGGEPLVNMETVKQVTEYARKREKETGKSFKLTLTTNGLLLNEENIKFLNDNNISLVLSLDGRKETHDRMRPDAGGNGTYERALQNFKRTVASRGNTNYYLRGTYTAKNLDFTADVLSMADEGFNPLSVEPVVMTDGELALTEEMLPQIFAEYDKLAQSYLNRLREGKGFFFFHFNMDLSNGPCVAKRLSGCGAGHEYCAVAADGKLYPCHQFVGREKYLLGDVEHGITNKELPKEFRTAHVLNKEKCPDCWARFFCSGGCHANADLFHGNIRKPYEIGCALQKKRLECALYVQAVMKAEGLNVPLA